MNKKHSGLISDFNNIHVGDSALHDCLTKTLEHYFSNMGDHQTSGLYNLVIESIEKTLFKMAMHHCNDNQTLAANTLGISRSTLRKKLKQYKLSL